MCFLGKIFYFIIFFVWEVSEYVEFGIIVLDWGKEFDVEVVFQNEVFVVIVGFFFIVDFLYV